MRWTSVTRDTSSDKSKRGLPVPAGRDALDFDGKWFDPENDALVEPFSSHVNPIFWRLHGWIDDRIEDWYRAQEIARPGTIKRVKINGVDWFAADGRWVLSADPWEGFQSKMPGMAMGVWLAIMKATTLASFSISRP